MMWEIQVLAWDRHVNVERLKQSNESHPFPLNNWMSNGYAYIYLYVNKQKTCADSLPLKKTTH